MFALSSNSKWYGITYNEDCVYVKDNIKKIVDDGKYQKELFQLYPCFMKFDLIIKD